MRPSLYKRDVGTSRPSWYKSAHSVLRLFGHDDTEEEICTQALDCLATALAGHALEGRPWPEPWKSRRGARWLTVPALITAKLELLLAMRQAKISNNAFAKRLGSDEKSIRRLLDLNHRSHIDQVEAALQKLGKRMEVRVQANECSHAFEGLATQAAGGK